jgi:hypothetical protein
VESVRHHLIDLLTPAEVEALATIAVKVIDHFAEPGSDRTAGDHAGNSDQFPGEAQVSIRGNSPR